MAQITQISGESPVVNSRATLFGAPIGELGWFASLLMGTAAGFVAFFLATFVGIVGIMIYNAAFHGKADYALSYTHGGLVVGSVVLLASWLYLGRLWVARITSKS